MFKSEPEHNINDIESKVKYFSRGQSRAPTLFMAMEIRKDFDKSLKMDKNKKLSSGNMGPKEEEKDLEAGKKDKGKGKRNSGSLVDEDKHSKAVIEKLQSIELQGFTEPPMVELHFFFQGEVS
jgi:hypothetical protein